MKTMIEVDIPQGRSVTEAQMAVQRAFSPDWMAEWWHIDDVASQAEMMGETLTEDECRDVLAMVMRKHDCNIGINWDFIDYWIEDVIKDREEVCE
jgi:hypothetical protein